MSVKAKNITVIFSIMAIICFVVYGINIVGEYAKTYEQSVNLVVEEEIENIIMEEEVEPITIEKEIEPVTIMEKIEPIVLRDIRTSNPSRSVEYDAIMDKINSLDHDLEGVISDLEDLEDEVNIMVERHNHYREMLNTYKHIPMPDADKLTVFEECEKYFLSPSLVFSLIKVESTYNPKAYNPKSGASGYGQFLPSTARWVYEEKLGLGKFSNDKSFDPTINIKMTCWYLRYQINGHGGDVRAALEFYGGCGDDAEFASQYTSSILN